MILRDYQEESLDALQAAIGRGVTRPLIAAPTGAGKSVILAVMIQRWAAASPKRRFLVLTHTKELVQQDYDAIVGVMGREHVGIYSAGLGRKDTRQRVIVGGIQSVAKHQGRLGIRDVVIIDEAHRLPRSGWGQYRSTLHSEEFPMGMEFMVGLTATPFRMDGGLLIEGDDAPFEEVVFDIQIQRLITGGFLSRLRPVDPKAEIETSKLTIRAGDFVADKRFNEAVSDIELLEKAVDGWRHRARKPNGMLRKTLVFCASLKQMAVVKDLIGKAGVVVESIDGTTADPENQPDDVLFDDVLALRTRTAIIKAFKRGDITALCNCNVLTTGFDVADIECILCLRPTASPVLYVQMMGRGTRIAEGKDDCLVLDHGGNVQRHGTIDRVYVPKKGQASDGLATRTVTCKGCETIYAIQEPACPVCGLVRPKPERSLAGGLSVDPSYDALLEAGKAARYAVTSLFHRHIAKSGAPCVRIDHKVNGKAKTFSEFFSFDSDHPYARTMAQKTWAKRFPGAPSVPNSTDEAIEMLKDAPAKVWPKGVVVSKDGQWDRVIAWLHEQLEPEQQELFPYVETGKFRDAEASQFKPSKAFDGFVAKVLTAPKTEPDKTRHNDQAEEDFWRDILEEDAPF